MIQPCFAFIPGGVDGVKVLLLLPELVELLAVVLVDVQLAAFLLAIQDAIRETVVTDHNIGAADIAEQTRMRVVALNSLKLRVPCIQGPGDRRQKTTGAIPKKEVNVATLKVEALV